MKKIILIIIGFLIVHNELDAQVRVINEPENNRILVEFTMPSYSIADTNLYDVYGINQRYKYIFTDDLNFDYLDSIAMPELPIYFVDVAIPNNATVSRITTIGMSWINRNIDARIYPSQKSDSLMEFIINENFYNSSGTEFYNIEYQCNDPYYEFNQQGITLTLFPFWYNPKSSIIRELLKGTFVINYTIDESKSNEDQYTSDVRENYLSNIFQNYIPSAKKGRIGRGRLLIITPEKYVETLSYYINYRLNVGYLVDVATTEQVGDTYLTIKSYIQNRYNNLATRPDFLLLVGDVDCIPPSGGHVNCAGHYPNENYFLYTRACTDPITDLSYSRLDKTGDWLSDVFLGRWSISSKEELCNIINKTIKMEMNMDVFPKKATLVSGICFQDYKIKHIHNRLINETFIPNSIVPKKLDVPSQADLNLSLNDNPFYYIYNGIGKVSRLIIDGSTQSNFSYNIIDSAKNVVYPIFFSFSSYSNNFSVSPGSGHDVNYCLGEYCTRHKKGGIMYFGASSDLREINIDIRMEKYILKTAFSKGLTMGEFIILGKNYFYKRATGLGEVYRKRGYFSYNLLGDPTFIRAGIKFDNINFFNNEIFPIWSDIVYYTDLGEINNSNNFIINAGANLNLNSGSGTITLSDGFHAKEGSNFSARIGDKEILLKNENLKLGKIYKEDDDDEHGFAGFNSIDFEYTCLPNPAKSFVVFGIKAIKDCNIVIKLYTELGKFIDIMHLSLSEEEIKKVEFNIENVNTKFLLYEISSVNQKLTGKIIKN